MCSGIMPGNNDLYTQGHVLAARVRTVTKPRSIPRVLPAGAPRNAGENNISTCDYACTARAMSARTSAQVVMSWQPAFVP